MGDSKTTILGRRPDAGVNTAHRPLGTARDAGSPETPDWFVGDTPGPLGVNDYADPNTPMGRAQALQSHSEVSSLPIVDPIAGHYRMAIEARDVSVGKGRYRGAWQVSDNLAMKPMGPGQPDAPMAHANIELHLFDASGKEVKMTRRLVRTWRMVPKAGAQVHDLTQWGALGLEKSEFLPFYYVPGTPEDLNFLIDAPSVEDAPGLQGRSVKDPAFGILQEFIAGNESVGGVYYQVITLEDSFGKTRILTTRELPLKVNEYKWVLKQIDTGQYARAMRNKLYFMLQIKADRTTAYPSGKRHAGRRKTGR